jgi:nitrogen fixation protein NifU and related proteins
MYSPKVLDHFGNPRNGGKPARFTARGVAGDPSAGPYMTIYLDLADQRIAGIGFETYGCGAAIAAGSMLTELVKGKSVQEAATITPEILIAALEGLPLGKEHCAQIAIAALKDALGRGA